MPCCNILWHCLAITPHAVQKSDIGVLALHLSHITATSQVAERNYQNILRVNIPISFARILVCIPMKDVGFTFYNNERIGGSKTEHVQFFSMAEFSVKELILANSKKCLDCS